MSAKEPHITEELEAINKYDAEYRSECFVVRENDGKTSSDSTSETTSATTQTPTSTTTLAATPSITTITTETTTPTTNTSTTTMPLTSANATVYYSSESATAITEALTPSCDSSTFATGMAVGAGIGVIATWILASLAALSQIEDSAALTIGQKVPLLPALLLTGFQCHYKYRAVASTDLHQ